MIDVTEDTQAPARPWWLGLRRVILAIYLGTMAGVLCLIGRMDGGSCAGVVIAACAMFGVPDFAEKRNARDGL